LGDEPDMAFGGNDSDFKRPPEGRIVELES